MSKIVILGGGTFSHVRSHLALAAPAFGQTAKDLHVKMLQSWQDAELHLTKMADPASKLVTNEDVSLWLDQQIKRPEVRVIIFNAALCDYAGYVGGEPSGKYATRLKTSEGAQVMGLTPAEKLIGRIRQTRKDIFVVGFKTTTGATPDEQYSTGLKLLKQNSLNLVVANDTKTRLNMIIAPEETRYAVTNDRGYALSQLTRMVLYRMQNTFTRSTVIPGEAVPWASEAVPESLRQVVDHCRAAGAYKEVLGKTAGHFAVKTSDNEILTSIRKSNYNKLEAVGLVRVESTGEDTVIAHGHKPSVGGQSQRIIFKEHPEEDCIVHFHCPPKQGVTLPSAEQWPNECGSHECGRNTSANLGVVSLGDGHHLKVVNLRDHGPNIVFNRNVPAGKVIDFIDRHFDLSQKTGGLVS